MPEICGTCDNYTPDPENEMFFGKCALKSGYVAFHALCNIQKWIPREVKKESCFK